MAKGALSHILLLLLGTSCSQAKFLATNDAEVVLANMELMHGKVAKGDIDAELDAAVAEALGGGHGASKAELRAVEARMRPIFVALQKNAKGRVELPALRYLMHRYFSERHGWSVKGFEQHSSDNADTSGGAHLLKEKLPGYVEAVLEKRLARQGGFGLKDAVTMAVTLERLVLDESVELLQSAYKKNDLEPSDLLTHEQMIDVVRSYTLMHYKVIRSEPYDSVYSHRAKRQDHVQDAATIGEAIDSWVNGTEREWAAWHLADAETREAVMNYVAANPFRAIANDRSSPARERALDRYALPFEVAAEAAREVTEDLGAFQEETECNLLREALAEMDPNATGRIPYADFHGKRVKEFYFLEDEQYLRQCGALDETGSGKGPQVLIPNYVLSQSNCAEVSNFYSTCCLDPCQKVIGTIEREVAAPTASAEQIVRAMGSVYTRRVDELDLREGTKLRWMLDEVAQHSGSAGIPLHGRLLAQWLHYAFPHECPYPADSDAVATKTASEWESEQTAKGNTEYREKTTVAMDLGAELAAKKKEADDDDDDPIEDDGEAFPKMPEAQQKEPERLRAPPTMPSGWKLEEEILTSAKRKGGGGAKGGLIFGGGVLVMLLVGIARVRSAEMAAKRAPLWREGAGVPGTAERVAAAVARVRDESRFGLSDTFGAPVGSAGAVSAPWMMRSESTVARRRAQLDMSI